MKYFTRLLLLTICLGFTFVYSQDQFIIADGVTVETTDGTYIELAGDLVETGTGYLKGKVSSGARTGTTSFAGLALSDGLDGTIIRNTGTQYPGAPLSATNMKRYYELNNTGSTITPNVNATYLASGTNDEQNGLSGPYFIYNYDNPTWTAYNHGVTASPLADNSVSIPGGTSELVFSEGIKINSKIYLEGPYDATANAMTTTINGSIPTTSPYSKDPRTASTVPVTAVDWVLLEIRATSSGAPLAYRSCFLKSDGRLIGDDGSNDIGLPYIPGSYYVVVRHRNHLGIMSPATIPAEFTNLSWGGSPSTYDFSTGQAQAYTTGPDPMSNVDNPDVFAAISADADGSGSVDATDLNAHWRPNNGQPWVYSSSASADFNLDKSIDVVDLNLYWRINNGQSSQIP